MRHAFHNIYKGAAELVIPVRSTSAFQEKGVLTPEEFVMAGDTLVSTCPTWSWQGGEAAKRKAYLPPDKQYLITRNVPCLKRAAALESYACTETVEEGEEAGEDGWLTTHNDNSSSSNQDADAVPSMADPLDEDDDVPDMAEFETTDEEAPDLATLSIGCGYMTAAEPEDHIMLTRTYDLSISYDKYYQTPRVWLCGYDESRQPLSAKQALEDISHEHARKTVTLETHPHASIQAASIHPCQHASVMKKLSEMLTAGGTQPRVDQYLFLFLKFMQAIVPTIEYDYTMSVGR
mmetsp:Transcript_10287/g.19465  ORF Transcript_10287/g.19465 Transcript_10287/m.19465 type:complete len:291 (-) Transcript_10287:505-1377(-)